MVWLLPTGLLLLSLPMVVFPEEAVLNVGLVTALGTVVRVKELHSRRLGRVEGEGG